MKLKSVFVVYRKRVRRPDAGRMGETTLLKTSFTDLQAAKDACNSHYKSSSTVTGTCECCGGTTSKPQTARLSWYTGRDPHHGLLATRSRESNDNGEVYTISELFLDRSKGNV